MDTVYISFRPKLGSDTSIPHPSSLIPHPSSLIKSMFTGIIETTGTITHQMPISEGIRLSIACNMHDYQLGESIAVNGICLTVVSFKSGEFSAEASSETLARTNLGQLNIGSHVNLERALRLGDRLGGHWVSGHIDGTGKIARIDNHGAAKAIVVEANAGLLRYIVEKGSVTLDGASLTVNRVDNKEFEVMLIPHTQDMLFEGFVTVGRTLNIEVDILGKYVEKLLSCNDANQSDIKTSASLTLEKLREAGFA